jgi:ligand-binding sensor domain-containing protein
MFKYFLMTAAIGLKISVSPALANGIDGWTHIADYTNATDLVAIDGKIYAGSTRGAYCFSEADSSWQHWSITDGMISVGQKKICSDGSGNLFWADQFAGISIYDIDAEWWSKGIIEFQEHAQITEINDIWGDSGVVVVAHTIGLTMLEFSAEDDSYLVGWNLNRVGDFPMQSPILATASSLETLVLATSDGIAWGNGFPTEMQTADFSTFPDPAGISIITDALIETNEEFVIVSLLGNDNNAAVLSFDGNDWNVEATDLSSMAMIAAGPGSWCWIENVNNQADQFVECRVHIIGGEQDGIHVVDQSCSAVCYSSGSYWLALEPGRQSGGLTKVGADVIHNPDVPGADEFIDLDIDSAGNIWALGVAEDRDRNGLYTLKESGWKSWRSEDGLEFGEKPKCFLVDRFDDLWIGSWGKGLTYLDPDSGSSIRFENEAPDNEYTFDGQRLDGYENGSGSASTWELVTDIEEDAEGNIWLVNHQAINDSCIVVIPSTWHDDHTVRFHRHFYLQSFSNSYSFPFRIKPDKFGKVFVGVGGVQDNTDFSKLVLRVNGTDSLLTHLANWPSQTEELADEIFNFGISASGSVTDFAVAADNTIWIATDNGVYYGIDYGSSAVYSRVQFIPGLLDENVGAIEIDNRDRVWLGSSSGLNVYLPDSVYFREPEEALEFNSLVKNLSDFRINKLCFDSEKGEIWIASNKGLFHRKASTLDHGEVPYSKAIMWPNPLHISAGETGRIESESLSNGARIYIYDIKGRLKRELSLEQIEDSGPGWDGRDNAGNFLDSGVYIILVHSQSGSSHGKIAIIN